MKYLILLLVMTMKLIATEVDLSPYKEAKHSVVTILAKNSEVYDLSQDLAIAKHKEALLLWQAVAKNDSYFKMMYDQWSELQGQKDPDTLKRFYLIDNELEYHLLSQVKSDMRYSELYNKWSEAQTKLNEFRLASVKELDRVSLANAYKVMAKFRNN